MIRALVAMAVALMLLIPANSHASVSDSSRDFTATIERDAVSVAINIRMVQNLTALLPSFTLPEFSVVVDDTNSTELVRTLEAAFQIASPQARIDSLKFQGKVSFLSNSNRVQSFNVSLNLSVRGVHTLRGEGVAQVDMAWKAFTVSSNLPLGQVEVNNIGARYFVGPAEQAAARESSSTLVGFTFEVNGRRFSGAIFPSAVAKIAVLDFSSFSSPVSTWKSEYDFDTNSVAWSSSKTRLGMVVVRTITDPVDPAQDAYGLFYDLSFVITAPGGSSANGNLITTVFSDTSETLMGIVTVSVAIIGSAIFVYERRVLRGSFSRRPRR